MDSTVLMAAWQNLPDPGLMPPVSSVDREKKNSEVSVAPGIPLPPPGPEK